MLHDVLRRLQEREERLSPYAARSRLSRGRVRPEPPSPMRTDFQRDRDRVIHCKSFRRLKHKTQVFIAPRGDHYRTRLTHTLEVSQIARSIARALNLNEDLVEAIALGHDLGHTPFGHAGEEALNELCSGGFRHSEQSLRVVEVLEKDGRGLNLTWEVRDGIRKHSKARQDILSEVWDDPGSLEAQICKIADSVAYINHDIDDAVRAGVISNDDLPRPAIALLGDTHSGRINTLVCDIIDASWAATGEEESKNIPAITMSPGVLEAANNLREFLFQKVYESPEILDESGKSKQVVGFLFHYFKGHPDQLPEEYAWVDDPERRVVDYIAGMSDNYALQLAEEHGLPGVESLRSNA